MRTDRAWVDTALLHAIGRAYCDNVLTVQEHADEALVGEDMRENAGNATGPPIIAPIALVDNRHFWGNVEYICEVGGAPAEKGDTERCGHKRVWAYVLTPWATATPRAKAYVLAPPLRLWHTARRPQ